MKTKKSFALIDGLIIGIILCLFVTTIVGVLSFSTTQAFDFQNQYGDTIKLYGSGIYAHDSYFKAPIFIGTDLTMLLLVLPLLIFTFTQFKRSPNGKNQLVLGSLVGLISYYALSIAFGVTYNALHLVYIALVSLCFFSLIILVKDLSLAKRSHTLTPNFSFKGINRFLAIAGAALFLAWLPDIIASLMSGRPLSLIEVYTTEVTNVLDMGIISPLTFACIYLLKKRSNLGYVLLSILLTTCAVIGVMLPVQTLVQFSAGIENPLPALITKVATFVVLAGFSFYFLRRFFKALHIESELKI